MVGRYPAVLEAVVREWEDYRRYRQTQGVSLWRAAAELASCTGYQTRTVYLYLNPEARARERIRNRECCRRLAARATRRRTYFRNYRRFSRHPERYLPGAIPDSEEADLEAMANRIADDCEGIRFPLKTIDRVLRQYQAAQRQGRIRGPPWLHEVGNGVWRYSDDQPSNDYR
jgi:hypothetical protein